jgi:hypothetical protein
MIDLGGRRNLLMDLDDALWVPRTVSPSLNSTFRGSTPSITATYGRRESKDHAVHTPSYCRFGPQGP